MIAATVILLGAFVVWMAVRAAKAKELYELSRERKVILLSLHEAKPKPFRRIDSDKLSFRRSESEEK